MIREAMAHNLDWSGRSRRRELWAFIGVAGLLIVAFVLAELWIAAGSAKAPRLVFLLVALLQLPLVGLGVRRLHDRGHSGAWLVLGFVPWIGGLMWLYLLLAPSDSQADVADTPVALHLIGAVLTALWVLMVASRTFWAPYLMSSGSMKPNLLIGDVLSIGFVRPADVKPGDVIAFRMVATGGTQTARVIATAGDSVQMQAGLIRLNAAAVPQTEIAPFMEIHAPQGALHSLPRCGNAPVGAGGQCITRRLQETLPTGASHDVLDLMQGSPSDDTAITTVPMGQFFVLGDHRDDSLDSRFAQSTGGMGLIDSADIIGRVNRVILSSAGTSIFAFWQWRTDRFWQVVP